MIVAVIPARGGSKGIPRKNLMHVGGVSLVARSIRHAKACHAIASVWVSTDDPEIAAAATAEGASVIERPASLATDEASTDDVLVHAVGAIRASGVCPSIVVTLQPTTPFRQRHKIAECIALAPSFTAFECTHFDWSSGYPFPGNHRPRRQDRKPMLLEDGSVYATPVDRLLAERSRVFADSTPVMQRHFAYSVEIDRGADLAFAALLSSHYDVATSERP